MRITAITPMKNEGPYILEWLAYHLLIGVNDFVVFSNDCEDGTDAILDRLDEMGLVRHAPNPSVVVEAPDGHHWAVMGYINHMTRLRKSDWIISFDVDEFICIKTGGGELKDLFAALPDADFISMNQLNFGCAGVEGFAPDDLLLAQFDRSMAQTNDPYKWDRARGIKTLTRGSAPFTRMGNHSPKVDRDDLNWVNGSGVPVPASVYGGAMKSTKSGHLGYDLIQLNHYATRSMESFLVKTDRGDANWGTPEDMKHWRQYWSKYNDNMVEDRSIQRWLPQLREALDALLEDPELARLQAETVAWHKAKIAELREDREHAKLLRQIATLHARRDAEEQGEVPDL